MKQIFLSLKGAGISLLFFAVFMCCCYCCSAQSSIMVRDLECEHLVNPIGIDAVHPRLSWQLVDQRKGVKQTAYEFFLSADSAHLKNEHSEKIRSDAQLIVYKGRPLKPFTKYYWVVRVWGGNNDNNSVLNDKAVLSPVASFETGMMQMQNWKGSWISDSRDINLKPAPYFRKTFSADKKIISAMAYIAAAGLYEFYINGKKIGDHVLDPMYTRFDRRNLYLAYDVTKQLRSGQNAIGVLLGNGWYNMQSTAVWYFDKAPWRARPSFCMDIRITYDDGSIETISSDRSWKTTLSPVIFNSIYTGEHYDANKDIPGWSEPGFNDTEWKNSIYKSAPSKLIVVQSMQPIRETEKITALSVNKINDTDYVFNIGKNISGVSQITLNGEAGTVVKLKHGERLYLNGHVDLSNIDVHYRPTDDTDPFATDIYILNGKGEKTFKPHFNYKGFQYVEVTCDKPISLSRESLVAYFMHSDVRSVGNINSSNPTINKIWSATNNSYLSNLFGYPTDCPQREKNGWTGDAQINIETGLYNFDAITVYEKWMADHRDEQQPNGVLPSIIPSDGWGYEWGNGPDWTSSIAIIPWNLYLFYGDSKCLSDCYDNIKRYVDHINELYPSGLCSWGLGDWVPVKSESSVELTSTAYYFKDVTILAAAAKLFNKTSDQKYYAALASKIKNAFNEKFLNAETAIYGNGVQTELSVPLFWGLVPDNMISKVASNLAKRVIADGISLDVGLLGTKSILNALSENGYADLAYKLASKETFPSWGWWMVNGATTLYENWDINAPRDISMNHIMFGEIGAWFYKGLGGIYPDEKHPGFKHILLRPHIVAGLDTFSAEHESPFGEIISGWITKGKQIIYSVTIPANSTADLSLEMHGKIVKEIKLGSGTYSYSFPL